MFNPNKNLPQKRPYWLALVLITLGILVLAYSAPTWAAPPNQTVPVPTPTQDRPDPPTATPTPRPDNGGDDDRDDDDSDDDSGSPAEAPPPAPGGQPDLTGVVNVPALNVRSGPSTEFGVVGQFNAGDTVTVLGENPAGTWWRVCCAPPADAEGWVAARFINPNFNPAEVSLPVVGEEEATPTPEPVQEAITETVSLESTFGLSLTVTQEPAFAWQGQQVEMRVTVMNPSTETAENVEVRNEVPAGLIYVDAVAGDGGEAEGPAPGGLALVTLRWPSLPGGASVTGTIILGIDAALSDGAVIDNLVAAGADNAASASGGITIGLPPALPPDFK
jgi:uncharacterized repeat protein (TIGR01451 family)